MRLKICSFNILADEFIDFPDPSNYYPGIDPDELRGASRMPKIFKKIKELSPDVAMLQEMTKPVSKKFAAEFTEYTMFPISWHKTAEAKKFPYGGQIMVRKSIIEHAKPFTAYIHCTGGAVGLLDLTTINEQKIMFMNVHLDSENHKNRGLEAIALGYLAADYTANRAVIIGGDFNTDKHNVHQEFDGWFKSAVKESVGTYLCEKPMIDYIYVGGRGATVIDGYVDKRVCQKKELCRRQTIVRYGSDHYPVIAYVRIEQHVDSQAALCHVAIASDVLQQPSDPPSDTPSTKSTSKKHKSNTKRVRGVDTKSNTKRVRGVDTKSNANANTKNANVLSDVTLNSKKWIYTTHRLT